MKRIALAVLLLAVVGVAACGDDNMNEPTNDPAGVYVGVVGGTKVKIHLAPDGSYSYTMVPTDGDAEWRQDGTWLPGEGGLLMTPSDRAAGTWELPLVEEGVQVPVWPYFVGAQGQGAVGEEESLTLARRR